jgi:hypothetical protein
MTDDDADQRRDADDVDRPVTGRRRARLDFGRVGKSAMP